MSNLEKEYSYFESHRDEITRSAKKPFVVIVDEKVVGEYDTHAEAMEAAAKKYDLGEFLVQSLNADEAEVRFYSRVYV